MTYVSFFPHIPFYSQPYHTYSYQLYTFLLSLVSHFFLIIGLLPWVPLFWHCKCNPKWCYYWSMSICNPTTYFLSLKFANFMKSCITTPTTPQQSLDKQNLNFKDQSWVVLPWLGWGSFNKIDINQGALLLMLRSKIWPLSFEIHQSI